MTARHVAGVLLEGESLVTARALVRVAVQSLRDRDAVAALSPAVAELEQLLSRAVAELRSEDDRTMSPPRPQGHPDTLSASDRPVSVPGGSAEPRRAFPAGRSPGSAEITTGEASSLLNVSTRQVRRLRTELGGVYRGKDLHFDRQTVEAYAALRTADERN